MQQVFNANNTGIAIGGPGKWASVTTEKSRRAFMESPTVLTSQLPRYTESSIIFACSEFASGGLLSDHSSLPTMDSTYGQHETLNYFSITKAGLQFIESIIEI